jgi:predicted phage terminase large subunit-like protein
MAVKSFYAFVVLFWQVLEPVDSLEEDWYVKAICEHLEALYRRVIRRLIINMPPRSGKSTLLTLWSVWVWLQDPTERILASSYALELSVRDNRRARLLIESPLFKKLYGGLFAIAADENRKERFEVVGKTGFRLAHSVESFGLGEGGSIIIIDDPNNIERIYSKTERDKVARWYKEVMISRPNPRRGVQVVCQQRCHSEDLTGTLLAEDKTNAWCQLILPYEYDGRSKLNKIGWKDPREKIGQRLHDRFDQDELSQRKATGSVWFAQYQQQVVPDEGEVFKRAWLRYHHETASTYELLDSREVIQKIVPKTDCWYLVSADLAVSEKLTADWTVLTVWAVNSQHDMILVDMIRRRMDIPDCVACMRELYIRYGASYVVIEDTGGFKAWINEARRVGLTVRAFLPRTRGDKKSGAVSLAVRMESGQVFWPIDKPFMPGVEEELLTFGTPQSKNDDIVDSCVQAVFQVSRPFQAIPKKEPTAEDIKKKEEAARLERQQAIEKWDREDRPKLEADWAAMDIDTPPPPGIWPTWTR